MANSNLYILIGVAVVAAIFLYTYANPTAGVEGPQTVDSTEVREILLLEANELNITITERELKSAYLGLQNKSEMNNETYEAYVIEQHGSMEAFESVLENNLKVLKVINDQVNWSRIDIKDEDIDAFIAQNPEIFPQEQLNDPAFKETLYQLARQQMFETQRQQLINEYVETVVSKHTTV